MTDPDRASVEKIGIGDAVGIIAAEMRARFGTGSLEIALAQRDLAGPDAVVRWTEIVARLGG